MPKNNTHFIRISEATELLNTCFLERICILNSFVCEYVCFTLLFFRRGYAYKFSFTTSTAIKVGFQWLVLEMFSTREKYLLDRLI